MRITITILFFMLKSFCSAQEMNEHTFDFWVGNWNIYYFSSDSTKKSATNEIVKIIDGKVIQENFNDLSTGFKGTSISVFNLKNKTWHQAWADNSGGYFNFYGLEIDGNKIFRTNEIRENGKSIIYQMTFHHITESSFIWEWEISTDSGLSWELKWQLFYQKRED